MKINAGDVIKRKQELLCLKALHTVWLKMRELDDGPWQKTVNYSRKNSKNL
jgi:hypothetical protein